MQFRPSPAGRPATAPPRLLLLHNPKAGRGEFSRETLRDRLATEGFDISYRSTSEVGFYDALEAPPQFIVVAGGDGTVARAALSMPDRSVPLAILPLGTANNAARSLGIPAGLDALARTLRHGTPRQCRTGQVTGPWGTTDFIEAAGFGALAATLTVEGKPLRVGQQKIDAGRAAFAEWLRAGRAAPVTLRLDGQETDGEWLAVEILNQAFSGPCLPLAEGRPDDDSLDVIAIGPQDREAVIAWLKTGANGRAPIPVRRAREVRFVWDGSLPLRVDDALMAAPAAPAPVTISVQPIPITVLVPPRNRGEEHEHG